MLDSQQLAAVMYKSITDSVGEGIPSASRWPLCKALADAIITYITTYAEVEMPDHDPRMTDPAGAFVGPNFVIPDHRHETTTIPHKIGKIK